MTEVLLMRDSFPPGTKVVWAPATTTLDGELAKLIIRENDCYRRLSDHQLTSITQLQPWKQYLAFGGEDDKDDNDRGSVGARGTRPASGAQSAAAAPGAESNTCTRTAPTEEDMLAKKKRKTSRVATSELMKMLLSNQKMLLSNQEKHNQMLLSNQEKHNQLLQEITQLKEQEAKHAKEITQLTEQEAKHAKEITQLTEEIKKLTKFQKTGSTLMTAAFSLAEFAVETASVILRRMVAESLLGELQYKSFKEVLKIFRRSFHTGFIEDVDFCRAVGWEYSASGMSLADYWSSCWNYTPQKQLCENWYNKPSKAGDLMAPQLKCWLRATEDELASKLGVAPELLRIFLRVYSTAVRHERNSVAHFFSVYNTITRTRRPGAAARDDYNLDEQQCIKRLAAAKVTPHKVLVLDELQTRYWVVQQISKQVEELNFFKEHATVFRGFLEMLESNIFPSLVAHSINNAEAVRAERFGFQVRQSLVPGGDGLVVEKSGMGWFRYKAGVCVWEQWIGGEWKANGDAWKLLLGV